MIVFRHLYLAYRRIYAVFLAIMALLLIASVVNPWRVPVWPEASAQAPRWFLFVAALMFVTMNLPVLVAHGITRRTYFAGAMLFSLASSIVAASVAVFGSAVERWVFHANALTSWRPAGRLWLELFLTFSAFMVSGWLAGLVFYRLRVWVAILCTPLAAIPLIAVSSAPLGKAGAWELGGTAAAIGLGVAGGYLLVRGVAIRPVKV